MPSSPAKGSQTTRPLNISCPTQFPGLNSSQGNGPAATGGRAPPTYRQLGGQGATVDRSKSAPHSEQPQAAPARPAAIEKPPTNGTLPSNKVDTPNRSTGWQYRDKKTLCPTSSHQFLTYRRGGPSRGNTHTN